MKRGYDAVAERFTEARKDIGRRDAKYLSLLLERLPAGSEVLDLSCGSGVPITNALAGRHRVTGVDFSAKQIELARKLVPQATFRTADMTTVSFPPRSFDAVCSFHAIIHVPREEHRALVQRIHRWLKPGGLFLVTFGADDWVSSDEDRFLGVPMFWSQFDPETAKKLVRESGFRILRSSIEREVFIGEPEEHLYLLAARARSRKRGATSESRSS